MSLADEMAQLARQAKAAARALAKLGTGEKNACLLAMAASLEQGREALIRANHLDMSAAELADHYRGDAPPIAVRGRTAVIVDDGLATGATAAAAVRSVKGDAPKRVIVAVPVCAAPTAIDLRREVDAVVCLGEYDDFHAVGMYYDEFASAEDDQVRELIAESRHAPLGR